MTASAGIIKRSNVDRMFLPPCFSVGTAMATCIWDGEAEGTHCFHLSFFCSSLLHQDENNIRVQG